MDGIEIILTALAAGTATGMKDAAAETVKDIRAGLVMKIKERFSRDPKNNDVATTALEQYEAKPEVWREPLRHALIENDIENDLEILQEAQRLLLHVNPQQVGTGKYTTQITGPVQGFTQGDHADVTMTFNGPPAKTSGEQISEE